MVIFEKLRYKNFFASGAQFIEIILNEYSTTIISGKNGSGKSTLLDALTFVLFGRPFRNINKPNVVNSINQRDCVVEIEFTIGEKRYKVVRGIKPNIFEIYCDGVLVNQDSKSRDYQSYLEKSILKMNYKAFTQIVALGSAIFVPFMQLSASDRRNIIEDLLDIQIFSSMNVLLKQKLLIIKDNLDKIKVTKEVNNAKIEATNKIISSIKNNNQSKIDRLETDIKENKEKIAILESNRSILEAQIKALEAVIQDETKVKEKSQKLLGIEGKLTQNRKRYVKELEFYESNHDCPTCQQGIDQVFKGSMITDRTKKIEDLDKGLEDLAKDITKASERLSEIHFIQLEINQHDTNVTRYNSEISLLENSVKRFTQEISDIKAGDHGFKTEQDNLDRLLMDNERLDDESEKHVEDRHYLDIGANLLKDTGIKTKVVAQYLPIINQKINKYLSEMDFFVNFTLDENFSESIKSRHRDEFSYENFSEGEKTRIDLSLMFTWREIAKLKNSVNTNLIVFDEILDSSLDFGGIDILINILNGFGDKTNVFIISHKSDTLGDKFKNSIKFAKIGNFSTIVEK